MPATYRLTNLTAGILFHGESSHCLGIETASQSSLAKADELGWTVVSMKEDWSTVYGKLTDQ